MTPRELVYKTLEFKSPSRIPRNIWVMAWAQYNYPDELTRIREKYPDDITGPTFEYRFKPSMQGDPYAVGTYIDEWGCVFENIHRGIIGEVKKPLLCDLSDWNKIRIPEELLTFNAEQVNSSCGQTDKFVLAGCCPRPFERLQFIRGSANLYMDLAMESSEIHSLLNRIHQFYLEKVTRWCQTKIDGIFFMDDWGSQQSLLISPAMWRQVFKPLYKDYITVAHKYGKKIFMHSDGYILDILPDLVELGLDAINSQIFCMGIEELGKKFSGKITFWGEIDRQHLLPEGTKEDICKAVQDVGKALYRDGGVIAQCEFGPAAKPENVEAVFEEWNRI